MSRQQELQAIETFVRERGIETVQATFSEWPANPVNPTRPSKKPDLDWLDRR